MEHHGQMMSPQISTFTGGIQAGPANNGSLATVPPVVSFLRAAHRRLASPFRRVRRPLAGVFVTEGSVGEACRP